MTDISGEPDPDYAAVPGHPLHDVPLAVLEAARHAMNEAAQAGDIDADLVQPLADSVVMGCLPAIRSWLKPAAPGNDD
jgi:hypothetical protein